VLIYESRARVIAFAKGATFAFPSKAKISASFEPRIPFGGATGRTRNTVAGAAMRAKESPSTGHFFMLADSPLFPPLAFSAPISGAVFSANGHEITVEAEVGSIQEVADLLGALCYAFPGILNLYLPDSPYAHFAWGDIGGVPFQWQFSGSELRASLTVTTSEHQQQLLVDSWQKVDLVRRHPRLFMALHYFRVACRLLHVGSNRFAFMAEVVLNLSKSLQSLCGEKRDEVRQTLSQLGISELPIEALYLPAMFLRDAFDVAHVSLTQYAPEQLAIIHRYVDQAEASFRTLLAAAIDRVNAGTFQPKQHTPDPNDSNVVSFLATLERNLNAMAVDK